MTNGISENEYIMIRKYQTPSPTTTSRRSVWSRVKHSTTEPLRSLNSFNEEQIMWRLYDSNLLRVRCMHCFCYSEFLLGNKISKIVSECDQEIPQSQTADNPVAL